MAPKKTLYVKDADAPLWERFETAVREWQAADSVSALIAEAMRQYFDQFGDQGDGLYVQAPDEDPGWVTFGDGRTAILQPHRSGWMLLLDEDVYGQDADTSYEIGFRNLDDAIAAARKHMATVRQNKGFELIEVMTGEGYDITERFVGRWLVWPDSDETRADVSDFDGRSYDAGAYWGVALGKRGRFVVYVAHCNEGFPGMLTGYDTLDEAVADLPPSIAARARAELTGEPIVIERDF
jgi:hypothetical protein